MEKWELTIVNETQDGYLVMSPNGDTQWMTKEDYQKYLNTDRKSTRLNSSHSQQSRMPSSA